MVNPAWTTGRVPEQLVYHSKTLSQNKKVKGYEHKPAVEHLLSRRKALESIPVLQKQRNTERVLGPNVTNGLDTLHFAQSTSHRPLRPPCHTPLPPDCGA